MKITTFILALMLLTSFIHAQSPKKATTVRIKKIENVNGVQKITDTTFTTDDPQSLKYLEGNTSVSESSDGARVIKISTDGKEDVFLEPEISENGIITIESDGTNRKKIMIKDLHNPGDSMLLKMGKPLTPEEEAIWKESHKNGTLNEEIIEINTPNSNQTVNGNKIAKVIIMKRIMIAELSDADKTMLAKSTGMTDGKLNVSEMKFFPNPNDGKFNLAFTLADKGNASITIFNVEGKTIYSENLPNFSGAYQKAIDISENPKGIYFVKVQQGDHSQLKKIVLD